MEQLRLWREIITANRNELINSTDCNPNLITKLEEKKLLSKDDKHSLACKLDRIGPSAQSDELYTIIDKKLNGFPKLYGVLIQPGIDQFIPAKILFDGAKKKGIENGLPELPPEAITDDTDNSTVGHSSSNHEQPIVWLPDDLKNWLLHGKELTVKVDQPDNAQIPPPDATERYELPPKGRGYAFILNIISVNGSIRRGADKDTKYMVKLMEGLGYEIFPEDPFMLYTRTDWTKENIANELEKFKKKCIRDLVNSIVVFVGSHGLENTILTAKGEQLNIDVDIVNKLQIGISEVEHPVAKIFINQSCQGEGSINPVVADKNPPKWDDTICIKAQMPKYPANRDDDCGSYFVIVLAYVLMKKARDTSLVKMLEEVQGYLRTINKELPPEDYQISPFTMSGLRDGFYFFTKRISS